jgi:hypothetical protein
VEHFFSSFSTFVIYVRSDCSLPYVPSQLSLFPTLVLLWDFIYLLPSTSFGTLILPALLLPIDFWSFLFRL